MRRNLGLAAALLAGTMFALPAIAQKPAGGTEPRISGADHSASQFAPGRADEDARDVAPGQQMRSGEVDQAMEAAPGRMMLESDTEAVEAPDGDTDSPATAREAAPGQLQRDGTVDSAAEAAPGQRMRSGEIEQATEAAPGQVSGETTASIDLTTEQRVEIRNVIQEVGIAPVEADFEVSVGAAVPQTVTIQPLPPRLVSILPAYERYHYFLLADGRIVIVEPATLEVVHIILV